MEELICDKCETRIPKGANFCPSCGDPVTEADIVTRPEKDDHVPVITIIFGYSSSSNYDTAVEISKNIPSFTTKGEGKDALHELELEAYDVALAIKVWEIVGGWKSSNMTIDGDQATKKDLVYGGLGCFQNQQDSPRPDQYCYGLREHEFNIWGCQRLGMPLTGWASWLQYGAFDDSGIWHFDKEKIRKELELKIHENKYCPLLNPKQIFETLDRIPDAINPKTDPNWEYITHREYGDDYSSYQEIAQGIKPILEKATSSYVVREQKPDIPRAEREESGETVSRTIRINLENENDSKRSKSSSLTNNRGCVVALSIALLIVVLLVASL